MMDGLAQYPTTKDSGLVWLGDVPEHWQVLRGKSLLRCVDIRSKFGNEELLTVSSERGIVPRRSTAVTMFKAESYVGHKLCWPGDLVVNSLWAWARGLGVARHHGIISTAYSVYRLHDRYSNYTSYLHELVRSTPFQWELQVRSKGVWISRLQLTDESFLQAPFPVPPEPEQHAIARYLTHATRRIHRYIRAKQKLIALLEEQKQAIIHRAVTRGLDPGVRMKASGVEWLGEVPEHWEAVPLRRRWSVTDCKHLTVPFVEDGVPLVSVREVQSFDVNLSTAKRTAAEWYAMLSEGGRRPRRGDLIYCRNVSVGAAGLVNTDEPLAMGQDVCLIRSAGENQRYLNYYMRGLSMKRQLAMLMVGSTFDRINVADIKGLIVVVPPRDEQDAIAAQLDQDLAGIDDGIANAQRTITLLREYRTRLIADVVTGKLDVRAAAAGLAEEVDEEQQFDASNDLTVRADGDTDCPDVTAEEIAS